MAVVAGRVVDDAALRDSLLGGLDKLGLAPSAVQVDALIDFVGLLVRWNRVYNLTSVREPGDMLPVHLLDSLAVLPLVRDLGARRIVDVGTGPGLPGIPLAICAPDVSFDLVDAVAKKIAFVQQAKTTLALANVRAHHARVEALTLAESPDLIVSRAYAEVGTMLRSVDRLAAPSTVVVAMKAAVPDDELTALPAGWRLDNVVALDVPGLGARRCALVLRRAATES